MADIATIGLEVDSKGVVRATKDMENMSKSANKLEKSTNKVNASAKKSKGPIESASNALKSRLGPAALGAAAGLAVVAVGAAALSRVRNDITIFTQSIADLSAITGASGQDLEFYEQQALRLGRTTSFSASQVVEGFKLIGSAKPDLLSSASALSGVTENALTLAEAAGIALPDAASALGSALNQFGLDASRASEVINILAAGSKFGAAEIPAVTEALRNAGPAANALSVDLAETVAGIEALAISGRQGADAGTSLRQVMLRLEKTADAELQPSVVGLAGAIKNLGDRNLSTTALMELLGDEAFSAGAALIEQSDTLTQLNKELRGTDTATKQAAIRMDTLKGDTLELDSAMEGLSLTIGNKLEPALRFGTQGLTNLINLINDFIGEETLEEKAQRALDLVAQLERQASQPVRPLDIQEKLEAARAEADRLQKAIWEASSGQPPAAAPTPVIDNTDVEFGPSKDQIRAIDQARDSLSGLNESIMQQAATLGMAEPEVLAYRLSLGDLAESVKTLGPEGRMLADSIVRQSEALEQAKLDEEYTRIAESLADQTSALRMTERELYAQEAVNRLSADASAYHQQQVRGMAEALFDEKEAIEQANEARERGISIMESLRTPMEEYIANLKEIDELESMGALTADQAATARDRITDGFIEASKAAKDSADDMTEFMKEAAENIQNVLADNLFDFMQGEFEFTSDSFKKMLDRMVADALAAQVGEALFGNLLGGGGGAGLLEKGFSAAAGFFGFGGGSGVASIAEGLPSSIPSLSFDGGGYTGDGARSGGLDGKGGFMAVMHPRETVTDHTKPNQSGGIMTINVNISGVRDGRDIRQSADQAAMKLMAAGQRAMQRNG